MELRKSRAVSGAGVAAFVAVVIAIPTAAAAAPACQLKTLPVPAGVTESKVTGGDHTGRYLAGQGQLTDADYSTVVLRWKNGKLNRLDTRALEPYVSLWPTDVNANGVVVGTRLNDTGAFHTDAWQYRGGHFSLLPGLTATDDTEAHAINARGDIVGVSGNLTETAIRHAVIWPAAHPGTVRELVPVGALTSSVVAVDIDADGTVLGFLGDRPSEEQRPYIWPAHGPGYVLNGPAGSGYPEATAVHNGWVVGTVDPQDGTPDLQLVRWNLRTRKATVVGTAPWPKAVNRQGTIATVDALYYPGGRVREMNGYVSVLSDDGTAAGATAEYNGIAAIWKGC